MGDGVVMEGARIGEGGFNGGGGGGGGCRCQESHVRPPRSVAEICTNNA